MTEKDHTEKNPWQTLNSEVKYENPWIKVTEHQVINFSGEAGIYGTVDFKHHAIGIIPVDEDGNTWLVGQYRYPLKQYSWEIPEGGGKIDVDPLDSARRELEEETGLTAGKWDEILNTHLSNSVSNEWGVIYVATDLTEGEPKPESDEDLVVRKLPLKDAIEMVHRGEITDSLSVMGLLKMQIIRNL